MKEGEREGGNVLLSRPLLDLLLTLHLLTPGNDTDIVPVESLDKVLPLGNDDRVRVELDTSLGEHVGLDLDEEGGDGLCEIREGEGGLGSVVTTDREGRGGLEVLGSEFKTDRNSLRIADSLDGGREERKKGDLRGAPSRRT
jgi:hypothetical protein